MLEVMWKGDSSWLGRWSVFLVGEHRGFTPGGSDDTSLTLTGSGEALCVEADLFAVHHN